MRSCAPSVDFELPAAGCLRGRHWPSCPTTSRPSATPWPRSTGSPRRRTSSSSAGARCPSPPTSSGSRRAGTMPRFRQLFVASRHRVTDRMVLERMAFCLRKRAEREAEVYFASLSSRTLVYKGMLTTGQLEPFFPDLSDPRIASTLALVHSRFSTNTFPSWSLAHPYRLIAHNGEINTVRGNRNWMQAREAQLNSEMIPGDIRRILPICTEGASDSASFDEVVELLHMAGRSLPHSVLMMIPEAWENHDEMDPARRAFYQFHANLMEPWDGPANVSFTDGSRDRRGPGPQRPAPRTVLGHRRGPGGARLRGRCARHRPGHGRAQGPPAAGPDVPGGHRRRADHRGRRDQGRAGRPGALRGLAARGHRAPRGAPRARARGAHLEVGGPPPADVRVHRGGAADPAHPDGPQRPGGAGLDGHRHPDRRAVGPAPAAVRLLHPALRPGDQPAAGRDPRGDRHLAGQPHRPGGQPAGGRPRALPAGPAALPGDRQRRAREARPDQRRR